MSKTPLTDSALGRILSPATEGFYKGDELDPILRVTASLALAIIAFSGSYLGCYFGVTQAILPLVSMGGGAAIIVGPLTWIALSSCLRQRAPPPDLEEGARDVKRVLFPSSPDAPPSPSKLDELTRTLIVMAREKDPTMIEKAEQQATEAQPEAKHRANSFQLAMDFLKIFKTQHGPTIERTNAGDMIEVAKDGDCVFTAFATTRTMNGSEMVGSTLERKATALRKEATDWITANYATDRLLQSYLVQAMAEHWSSSTMQFMKGKAPCQERVKTLEPFLIPAMMSRHGQTEDFFPSKVQDLVETYLSEMAEPKTFAALPEIYALAKMRHCSVKIYSMDGNRVTKEPTEVINPEPLKNGFAQHAPSHFAFFGKHYTPFVPSEGFLALSSKGTSGL